MAIGEIEPLCMNCMESLPPQTHRLAHRWNRASSLGDWFFGMNIFSLLVSFVINIRKILYRNPHLPIVLETEARKQLMWILGSTTMQVKKGKWHRRHSMYVITIISAHYFNLLFFILMFLSENVTALVDERITHWNGSGQGNSRSYVRIPARWSHKS